MARPKVDPSPRISKVPEEKPETPPVGAVVKDALSPDHLRQLETLSRDIEIARLQRTIKEHELKQKTLEQKIVAYEIEALQRGLVQLDVTHESKKKLRSSLVFSFKEAYGISDNFGYNPETGMIVRD